MNVLSYFPRLGAKHRYLAPVHRSWPTEERIAVCYALYWCVFPPALIRLHGFRPARVLQKTVSSPRLKTQKHQIVPTLLASITLCSQHTPWAADALTKCWMIWSGGSSVIIEPFNRPPAGYLIFSKWAEKAILPANTADWSSAHRCGRCGYCVVQYNSTYSRRLWCN